LIDAVNELLAKQPKSTLQAVGVGAPNANYYTGCVEHPPNLNWGASTPLQQLLFTSFKVPVVLINDATAAAAGELYLGKGIGLQDFVLVTLGTGLGAGIVANGSIVHGMRGMAGELGHTMVNPNGRFCGCGRRGCLETYVSATGIRRTVYKLLADYTTDSPLRNIPYSDLEASVISKYASNGDSLALEAFDYTGRILGTKLADAAAILGTEKIFLFGGLVFSGELLLAPTRHYLEQNLSPLFKGKVSIEISGLQGKNAAVLGLASLAMKQ
jgi:glucokinase